MRALAILASIAMIVSLFLPWLNAQATGVGFTPWDLIKQLDPDIETLKKLVTDSPPEFLAFLASFLLAGLFCLLAILGAPSRLLAFLAGGGALGLLGYGLFKMRDQAAAMGIPLPGTGDLAEFAKSAPDVFGIGAFAWAGGAVVLLMAALIGFGDRR